MIAARQDWDRFLSRYSEAHVLQTSAWGEVKAQAGWYARYLISDECGAQVLFRRLAAGLTIAYIPKGPIGLPSDTFWCDLEALCRTERAVFLNIEPDLWQGQSDPMVDWLNNHALPAHPVQPRQTIILDLRGGEEAVLARMKQKTRYNIHLAEKKEITVREWDDLPAFSRMMQVTSERDGFGVHSETYYRNVYAQYIPSGAGKILVAEYQGTPLAAVFVLKSGRRAWYFYGASTNEERNRMPTYLLQWQAIRWALQTGCEEYDLWGIPDAPEAELEAGFTGKSDGLWGVYRFKRGFGGEIKRSAGAWEIAYQPLLYRLYRFYMSRRRAGYTD